MIRNLFTIRNVAISDISEIINIQKETGLSVWNEKAYVDEIERVDSLSFVAVDREKVVGFLVARIIAKREEIVPCEIEIYNIGVSRKYQKQGIGTALIRKILDGKELRPARIWLEVRETNQNAINFYQKHSFEKAGIRKNFFSSPNENAILMKCEIELLKIS